MQYIYNLDKMDSCCCHIITNRDPRVLFRWPRRHRLQRPPPCPWSRPRRRTLPPKTTRRRYP